MAFDKITKVDSIAKRKAWSKVNQGALAEHVSAYQKAGSRSYSNFKVGNSEAVASLSVSKRGKLFRRGTVCAPGITTSWPDNHKTS